MNTKAVVLILSILFFGVAANAQSTGNTGQAISLQLQPVIDISFINLEAVEQNLNATDAMAKGKIPDCGISINANKRFIISIEPVTTKQSVQRFDDKFSLLIVENHVNEAGSGNVFKNLTKVTSTKPLVKSCENGSDQQFYIAYQSSNENHSLLKNMTGNVVCTATLP